MNFMQNNAILEKIEIAGFILKPDATDIKDIYLDIKKMFENAGIEVLLEKTSADQLGITDGFAFEKLCKESDFLVTLGGDGTLISVARRGFKYQKAVMGINLGTLGFLTDIMPEEIEPAPSFGTSIRTDFIKGMGKVGGKLLVLLDITYVLSIDELSVVGGLQAQTES